MIMAFRILWFLLIAFIVVCMVQSIRTLWNYDKQTSEVDKLKNSVATLRWLLVGWIALSVTWAIVRFI